MISFGSSSKLKQLLSTVGRFESRMTVMVISPKVDMLLLGEFGPSDDFDVVRIEPASRLQAKLRHISLVFSCCSSSS
jgi:hypothetical protein